MGTIVAWFLWLRGKWLFPGGVNTQRFDGLDSKNREK